jgi:CubicO group peptidase (beta-lactamase class C family)
MKKQIIVTITICILLSINIAPATISIKQNTNKITNKFDEEYTISDFILDNYIQILMKIAHKPSIAAGIIYDDNLVWSKGYGFYDLENQKKTNEDILYLQASVSKTVTATALMQLFEKGLFDLDDDVNDYLPFNLRNPNHPEDPITIKMILSHRSSLADDNLYWIALSYLPGDPDVEGFPYPWLEDYLVPGGNGYSSSTWSDAKPGENFYYANIGFSIIAYLVEILSNQNFNEYCKDNIFEPLQMYNSSFRLRDHNISNIAVPYEYKNGDYFRHPHYGIHILYPAITLRTSIEEFSHFIIAHMNGGVWNNVRILKEETADLMHTAHFSTEASYNYGLGWFISYQENGNKIVSHSGGYVGVLDRVTIFIDDDIAVMFFSNELDSELLDTYIERRAVRAINNALINKAYQITE